MCMKALVLCLSYFITIKKGYELKVAEIILFIYLFIYLFIFTFHRSKLGYNNH